MFLGRTKHICTLVSRPPSKSYLPTLPPVASRKTRIRRFFRRWILVAESNPNSIYFYRDAAAIIDQRKIQVASKSWIIHPFSMFRLFYEMWMTLLFLACFICMPLYASFQYVYKSLRFKPVHNSLCYLCFVDIIINFRTGRPVSNEMILMKPGEIARDYIFGVYFVCDVLSSIPDLQLLDKTEIVIFFGLLKIARFLTFWQYLKRSLNFFKAEGWIVLVIKFSIIYLLIVHYLACLNVFLDIVINHKKSPESWYFNNNTSDNVISDNLGNFTHDYLKKTHLSSASLLLIDNRREEITVSVIKAIFQIGCYILGKIFSTVFGVFLLDLLMLKNRLGVSYQAMISQVKEYMSNNHVPISLQNRVIKTYFYQHRGKFINQVRIERYISDKLKKEIKYHDCRKLIHSVKMFEGLPREVVEDILPHLKKEIYLGGDTIVTAGSSGDCMYFLESGTVAVLSPSGKEICHLSDGDYFGEYCLMGPKLRRSATVIALESCKLYKLERKSFKKCFQSHPLVYNYLQTESRKRFKETADIEKNLFRRATVESRSESGSLYFWRDS